MIGDDSVMEVSRTPSGAWGSVHRIYLGRTVNYYIQLLLPNLTSASSFLFRIPSAYLEEEKISPKFLFIILIANKTSISIATRISITSRTEPFR